MIKKLKRRVVELERELTLVKYNGITPSLQVQLYMYIHTSTFVSCIHAYNIYMYISIYIYTVYFILGFCNECCHTCIIIRATYKKAL